MKIGFSPGRSGRFRGERAEVIIAINTGVVTIVPMDANGVIADGFDGLHLQLGLKHFQRICVGRPFLGRSAMRAGAGGAGAFTAKEFEREGGVKAVDPVDFNSFGLADGDMFGFRLWIGSGVHRKSCANVFDPVEKWCQAPLFHRLVDALDIADAADAANGGDDALQLLLVFDVEQHADNGAAIATMLVGLGFQGLDVAALLEDDAG